MTNSVINTNLGTGGRALNADKLVGAGPSGEDIFRERVQITGASLRQVAAVCNTPADPGAFGLVIRNAIEQSDAFGRLRSSEPFTIYDSKQLFDNQPLFWDDQQVSGAGT